MAVDKGDIGILCHKIRRLDWTSVESLGSSDRKQHIHSNGVVKSKVSDVRSGVTQGSVL